MTDDVSSPIARMQQPDFYPHAVTAKIQLVQTHASWVVLTGDYAYKIKKSVNYGFLDYSTLEKRKHFLNEELRLNLKIAPQLYLEVLPISREGRDFILGSSKNIVEYALKMRQFAPDSLLSNLLKAEKLEAKHFIELGKIVAKFHKNALTNQYISGFGAIDRIKVAFSENYRQSQKYLGIVQTDKQFEATKAYSDRFFDRRQDLFADRIGQNKIKECHGDLHLKNICLWQGKIQLFDRIEFNESFRFVDTMYDVAFTVMDLEAREKPKFANAFLNSYLEHSQDWQGLCILPLYLCRQAYVRAKVNSFLLDDLQIPESDRKKAQQAAIKYYRQAYQYTKSRTGSLIIMSGLSGSGKSTVARTIARAKSAIQIRSDAVRKHLAEIPLDESGSDRIYTPEMTQKTYHRLEEVGIMLAKEGYTVILDAKYDRFAWRQSCFARAKAEKIPYQIVHCTAPIAVLRDRLKRRKNDISDATAELIAPQQANAEPFTPAERPYVIMVDTSQTNWRHKAIL